MVVGWFAVPAYGLELHLDIFCAHQPVKIYSQHIVKLPLLIRLLKTKRYLLRQGPYAIFFRNTILQSVMLLAQKQIDRLCTAKIPELPPKSPKT